MNDGRMCCAAAAAAGCCTGFDDRLVASWLAPNPPLRRSQGGCGLSCLIKIRLLNHLKKNYVRSYSLKQPNNGIIRIFRRAVRLNRTPLFPPPLPPPFALVPQQPPLFRRHRHRRRSSSSSLSSAARGHTWICPQLSSGGH
ncbi:uncharacterized protein BO95DRAFT_229133 [Aspergillus brunneoviolaceus CBS 621.78]|uniref:Uncharacterized protein n=1 Tax=Aspergillus brunneoviolaceus CBS 621.78 TaxID=1450534 RepID=A0ACD1G095_9EURO|nr:hypothetical protein BO95DRAFT_229133 [Aspergillus brunneoviolaceus CBS 621.78]RAH42659.1 hypothetical protein BO95DRAFT_229133 [Aspergillus brunneoviolaceus CBS 621.78]